MRDLHLVGVSEDGLALLLADDSGAEFSVAVDDRLRAALRGDRARLGQLEIEMDSALRPRDIQARIRAGSTPEEVAALAQVPVDKIMGYAVPVLAERRYIAERARRSSVRRRPGGASGDGGAARLLGECVAERLSGRGVDPAGTSWDAWRRDDGRWGIRVAYHSGGSERSGTFVYDDAGRYVVADDDDGHWLVGEQSASHGPQPREAGQQRRLASVPQQADALPIADQDDAYDQESTADLTGDVAGLRNADPGAETVQADDMAALADIVSAPAEEFDRALPDSGKEAGVAQEQDLAGRDVEGQAVEAPAAEEATVPTRQGARKQRRKPSVPSWDEIMFGKGTADKGTADAGEASGDAKD
jgi:hypothetical protein